MSRREIVVMVSRAIAVLLVSRAIAVLLVIPSLIGLVLTVPTSILTASMRGSMAGSFHSPMTASLLRIEWVALMETLLNVGLHVMAGLFFWFCGPMVERMLLPIPHNDAAGITS